METQYYIFTKEKGETDFSFKPVKGYKVLSPKDYEEFEFFAHKEGKEWSISEATTGLQVPSLHGSTKKDVTEIFFEKLSSSRFSPDSFRIALREKNKSPFTERIPKVK